MHVNFKNTKKIMYMYTTNSHTAKFALTIMCDYFEATVSSPV